MLILYNSIVLFVTKFMLSASLRMLYMAHNRIRIIFYIYKNEVVCDQANYVLSVPLHFNKIIILYILAMMCLCFAWWRPYVVETCSEKNVITIRSLLHVSETVGSIHIIYYKKIILGLLHLCPIIYFVRQMHCYPGLEKWEYDQGGSVALITWHPLSAKVGTNFTDKWRSLGWYSSLVD
jgi:hypothetical protein